MRACVCVCVCVCLCVFERERECVYIKYMNAKVHSYTLDRNHQKCSGIDHVCVCVCVYEWTCSFR